MSLWVSSVTVDGAAIGLDDVLADLTIRHGRLDVFDEPQASSCQIALLGVTRPFVKAFHTGALLVVNVRDGSGPETPRFTGIVTDATLDDDTLTAIAIGRLSTLGKYAIGAGDWPAETWSARVTRAFREAGLAPTNHVTNPGLETGDTSGWASWATGSTFPSVVLSTDAAHVESGAYALFWGLTNPDAAAQFYMIYDAGPGYPAVAGERWHMRVYGSGWGAEIAIVNGLGGVWTPSSWPDLFEPIGDGSSFNGANGANLGAIFTVPFNQDFGGTIKWCIGATVQAGQATVYGAADNFELWPLSEDVLELQVPPIDPMLAARVSADDGGPMKLSEYLGELAAMVGAAVVDRPDGRILVQPLSARTLDSVVALDPAEVEYSPAWVQVLPLANIVHTKWVGGVETVQDDGSIALYGPKEATIQTDFTDQIAARDRGAERLGRTAYPHWNVPAAPILAGRIYPLGAAVELTKVPPAAPYAIWTPVVEGWTDTITGDDWRMELALSDPQASGLSLPWEALAPADHWNTINQTVEWKDALTLDALETG